MYHIKWYILMFCVAYFGPPIVERLVAYECRDVYSRVPPSEIPFSVIKCIPALVSAPDFPVALAILYVGGAISLLLILFGATKELICAPINWFIALYSVRLKHPLFHLSMIKRATLGVSLNSSQLMRTTGIFLDTSLMKSLYSACRACK